MFVCRNNHSICTMVRTLRSPQVFARFLLGISSIQRVRFSYRTSGRTLENNHWNIISISSVSGLLYYIWNGVYAARLEALATSCVVAWHFVFNYLVC